MAYSPSDFGPGKTGPQILWYRWLLAVHGYLTNRDRPFLAWHQYDLEDTQQFQLAQGWKGTQPGGGADGLPGPKTLERLMATPVTTPAPPAAGIDLTPWKVTLPTGEEDHPTEWFPIGTHEDAPYFVNHGAAGVTFRADTDGVTTSGSDYPRCELREMVWDGTQWRRASWSNRSETHRLTGSCAVTALPAIKPEVVFAQIHDANDDVVMLLVSGDRVYASWSKYPESGSDRVLLFSGYKRGDRLNYVITASPSGIEVSVNGYKSSRSKIIDGAYFKAGCYTQASSRVDEGSSKYGTGYGEVLVYALSVTPPNV